MGERIQAVRGMNDILPSQTPLWRQFENSFIRVMTQYGYQEIRFPLVENTSLFKRTIGEITDIVEKEMYTFTDLNGDQLTLRPEGTAGCIRACLEHGLIHNQQQKLWYMGPMFRHERPQKGRYRQFNQLGVEAIGIEGVAIEVELLALCQRFWKILGIGDVVHLEINTLGELSERQLYKEQLVSYFTDHFDELDEDSKRRLDKNPLRILDSKNPQMQMLIEKAPRLIDALTPTSRNRFEDLCSGLDKMGISYSINPRLVRGLDYYGHTVFEWVTDRLGSQATVCAGGRYDSLVEQLGGQSISAIGFAMGIERLLLLLETMSLSIDVEVSPLSFFIIVDQEAIYQGLSLAEKLRQYHSNWTVITNTSGGSFKSQFKKADKSGAQFALILGEEEMKKDKISIKNLRNKEEQITISQTELIDWIASNNRSV